MASVKFTFDDKQFQKNIKTFRRDLRNEVSAVTDYTAAQAQIYLRQKAPWTDDTGAARSGLFAIADRFGNDVFEIFMAYSVSYGIWLEVANNRKYAVISPALPVVGNMLMSNLQRLIDRM